MNMGIEFLPSDKNRAEFNRLYTSAINEIERQNYQKNDDCIREMQELLARKIGVYPPYWNLKHNCEKCGEVPTYTDLPWCGFCDSQSYSDYLHDKFHNEVFDYQIKHNIKGTPKNRAFLMRQIYDDSGYDCPALDQKIKWLWASVKVIPILL